MSSPREARPNEPKEPTDHTVAANRAVAVGLVAAGPGGDGPADERARRGLLATHPSGVISHEHGVAWDVSRHDFVRASADAPDSVNPSLWRHARLDAVHGLFEVADGLYQARGYDISNVTFVRGERGWVVIDPLTTAVTAAACLELANSTLGARPVTAVIYTHSHADHFGGVEGVTSQAAVDAGDVRVIAPVGFLSEAVFENVIAGPAMARRAAYQFGPLLPAGPRQQVDAGLGIAIPTAPSGLIAPTEEITRTGEELVVDGVRIVFQNTPQTEAPAEMNFFFPDRGWLCMAENCTHTMHNLLPIRGAQARDALAWSKYVNEAIELFAAGTELVFASHHWPSWGRDEATAYLRVQRDLYRWMHDQTMRHANHGLTPTEIAERLELPTQFRAHEHARGYYGTLVHNVKAVYQRYLGWYDGNPAHLWQHPPVEAGRRYVELAGGAEALLANARRAFEAGDYRWVVEIVNHLVFADPANAEARELQADALEQLGYQAESATWRNAYLTGAQELRQGPPPARDMRRRNLLDALTVEQCFDAIAVRLRSEDVAEQRVLVNWRFPDIGEDWLVGLENGVLHTVAGRHDVGAAATVTVDRAVFGSILGGARTVPEALGDGAMRIDGDAAALLVIFGNLDVFQSGFPIVEP
ncbi:MAG: MBL fold metallo-hydrolase [Acidimicrobiia bacterium]|nr:MBL fold metallo-hydrolase [Acidimicrobiia bacterium]